MTNTEWALVGQAKKGDAHAFALLYQRYYKELFYFALSVVKHKETAEDVVGNAVLHAYEYLPSLKKDTAFKSWLFQITANECKRQLKKTVVSVEDYLLEEVETDEKGFSEVEISEYLKALTDVERLTISLTVFGGYTSKEVGKLIGKREGSVRSIKSRALQKLRVGGTEYEG